MPVDFKIVGKTDKYSRRLMRPSAGFLDLGMVTSEPWPFLRKATLITSGMTKTPNNIGVNEIPDINSVMPKVKRVAPVILDMPTMANNIPKQHEIKPLGMLFPAMVPITVYAKISKKSFSMGPAFSDNTEMGAATKINTRVAKASPVTEANSEVSRALPALPLSVNACPSCAVRKEAAAPGVLIKIAEMEPP